MAITFDIASTEIVVTTGETEVLCQDLLNAIRLFEDDFSMMSYDHIADASGKANLGGGVFSEIILTLRDPWTIRFADEASDHVTVRGGTFLALDGVGDPRPVSTNFGLTISQSVSGTLVESGVSGLTPTESTELSTAAATLPGIEADIALIQTDIGVMQGDIATIETDVSTIQGDVTSIQGSIATIETDIGTIELNLADNTAILRNRREIDPVTGIESVFESDSINVRFTRQVYEDVAGTQTYRRRGVERSERFV